MYSQNVDFTIMSTPRSTLELHRQRFHQEGAAHAAPARVNLIGEHTDYTGGFVMPMSIGFHTTAIISQGPGGRIFLQSENYNEGKSFSTDPTTWKATHQWSDYPMGVLWALHEAGIDVPPFAMTLSGDVPLGAGLSSSASIEVATAMALLAHAGTGLPLEKLAILCRRAENAYVGAKSGIMDQFIVAGGVAGRSMMLDTRALSFEFLPIPDEARIVICNSMVKHQVATGEYGSRRDEVEAAQAALHAANPKIELLRDATLADLDAAKSKMPEAEFRRARHIITENARVLDAREALLKGDLPRFGEIMRAAHISFRDDFQASCKEVDDLVDIANRQPGCFGARITGGGFGGCTVNLVQTAAADDFVNALRAGYKQRTGIDADCFITEPTDGALALAQQAAAQMQGTQKGALQ